MKDGETMNKTNKTFKWLMIGVGFFLLVVGSSAMADRFPSIELPNSELSSPVGLNVSRQPFRAINEEVTLVATVTPANATNKAVTWTSSDPAKVSVTQLTENTAKIKCLVAFTGNVVITATTVDGGFTATCTCTYRVAVTSLTFSGNGWANAMNLNVGEIYEFSITVNPTTATNKALTYSFAEPSKVDFNQTNGEIEILSEGANSMTVTSVDNPSVSIVVTWTGVVRVSGLNLNDTSYEF